MGQLELEAAMEIILQSGALEEKSKLHQERDTVNPLLLNTAEMFVSSGTEGCISYSKKTQSSQTTTTHHNGHMHEGKEEKNHPLCSAVCPFFA